MSNTAFADKRVVIRRLSAEDLRGLDQAIVEARELQLTVLERRSGKLLSPTWPIIRAAREAASGER